MTDNKKTEKEKAEIAIIEVTEELLRMVKFFTCDSGFTYYNCAIDRKATETCI